jgi:hypothetical protein
MDPRFAAAAAGELQKMREQGLLREEWPILGPQGPRSASKDVRAPS